MKSILKGRGVFVEQWHLNEYSTQKISYFELKNDCNGPSEMELIWVSSTIHIELHHIYSIFNNFDWFFMNSFVTPIDIPRIRTK